MANYFHIGITPAPFIADEDLTGQQWKLVKAASTVGNVASTTSACNPMPIGVLVNDPSAGQEAAVVLFGPTKAKARANACTLDHGAWLKAASNGFFEPLGAVTGEALPAGRWFGANESTTDTSVLGNVFVFLQNACSANAAC